MASPSELVSEQIESDKQAKLKLKSKRRRKASRRKKFQLRNSLRVSWMVQEKRGSTLYREVRRGRNPDPHTNKAKEGERVIRYRPRNKPIGEGGLGRVHSMKRCRFNSQGEIVAIETAPLGALKIQDINRGFTKEDALREYKICLAAGHLGVKPPTFYQGKCYLEMARMPGLSLDSYIAKHGDENRFSEQQKIELTRAILAAYKEQVSTKGIVHCDIKPQNIMVQLEPEIIVNIIDYGEAQFLNDVKPSANGTPLFIAPEIIFEEAIPNTASDLYSIGRILSSIWQGEDESYHIGTYINCLADKDTATPQQRFTYPANHRIERLVKGLLSPHVAARLTLDDAIAICDSAMEQFDTINISRLSEPSSDHAALSTSSSSSSLDELVRFDKDDAVSAKASPTEQPYQAVYEQLEIIAEHIKSLRRREHYDAANKLKAMHNAIKTELDVGDEADLSACFNRVKEAKRDLSSYKKTQFILTNLALAICGLFVGYGIALGWQKANDKPLGFFRPKTKELNNDLLATIEVASAGAA